MSISIHAYMICKRKIIGYILNKLKLIFSHTIKRFQALSNIIS